METSSLTRHTPEAATPVDTLGTTTAGMTPEQWQTFEEDGYVIIPNALSPAEVDQHAAAVDAAYDRDMLAGRVAPDGSLQILGAAGNCPPLARMVDHPSVLPLVWSILGWNVHIVHSHYNIHPPLAKPEPFRWRWHQDGGRQNVDIESNPRPRLSVFVAFWLSDVSRPDRGNMIVLPGSHKRDLLPGPPDPTVEWPHPDGAIPVQVNTGDAVLFDRRVWHTRTPNYSEITRKAVFFGYSYRWITMRDDVSGLRATPMFERLNPIQRQLLGESDGTGDDPWGLLPDNVPLYVDLRDRGLLDPNYRPHRRLYP